MDALPKQGLCKSLLTMADQIFGVCNVYALFGVFGLGTLRCFGGATIRVLAGLQAAHLYPGHTPD